MKKSCYILSILILILIVFSNCDDEGSSTNRSVEKIEVFIDGSSTSLDFSYNILAKDNPLAQQSGYSNIFIVNSEDVAGNAFQFNLLPSNITPQTVTTPSSESLNGPVSGRLQISGVTFDDTAANNLNVDYINFGNNIGDDIDITITGTYFDVSGTHSLRIEIHIHRSI